LYVPQSYIKVVAQTQTTRHTFKVVAQTLQ